jgi:hypothetical protein
VAGAQDILAAPLFSGDTLPPPRLGELELVGAFELRSGDPDFGGLSAARLDGARLYLLSDRSTLFEVAAPDLAAGGLGFRLPILAKRHLTAAGGRPLDAEALVLGRGGDVLVGDETEGRVFAFARDGTTPKSKPLRLPAAFAEAGAANLGLETLARLPDAGLLAIVEGSGAEGGSHVVAVLDEAGAHLLAYRAGDGYQVTDADVAGGWLLVLERRLSLIGDWRSRIVGVALDGISLESAATLTGRELALIAGPVLGENYEGLAARLDGDGRIEILIVADNNFNGFQRTQLLALRWRP